MSPTPSNPNLANGNGSLIARPLASFKPSPWTDRLIDYTPDINTINPNLDDGSDTLIARLNIASFKPSPWTDRFLDYTHDIKAIEALQEQAKELKEELNKEMQSFGDKPLMQQLCFIDIIERLGVAYHFEKEIEDALQRIHEMPDSPSDNLFLTSLRFRLLRQHGLNASSDVFKRFMNHNGSLKEEVANDVEGTLSLYEACYARGHEDEILDKALPLAISTLKSIREQPSHPLKEQVSYALRKPLHKWPARIESLHHMRVYKQDPSHNKKLLHFAKVDFNVLQSSHKKDLSDLCRWWTGIGITTKLPLRDRIVETYLWALCVYHEPRYALGRKFLTMGIQSVATVDDLYDAYGTPEELKRFTEAVRRWDRSELEQLPENLRIFATMVLSVTDIIERDLGTKGRSEYIHYEKEEMKMQCESYHLEAKWRQRDYVPTLNEYMDNVYRNVGYVVSTVFTILAMDEAHHAEFEWVSKQSKPVKSVSLLLRILDDIGSGEVDKSRGHTALSIECHMKHYGVSFEQACKDLYEKTDELWKDLNQALLPPREVPFQVLRRVQALAYPVTVFYDEGEDGYTSISPALMESIKSMFVDPLPIDED